MGYHSLVQGIFLTQGLNPALQADSLLSEALGKFLVIDSAFALREIVNVEGF